MRFATVCSGIGAPEVALARLGETTPPLWCAEVEKFPSRVLAERFPHTPNLGDITAPDFVDRAREIGVPDVIMAGTPCQSFSVAGRRGGLADERGNLALRYVEICDALDPDWIIWENVPGALSDPGNAFGSVLGRLAGADAPLVLPRDGGWPSAGVVADGRRRLVWRVLDAQHFGVAQRRKRVFVVASRGDRPDLDPLGVLFEQACVRRDSAPGGESAEVAGALTARGLAACSPESAATNHLISHTLRGSYQSAGEDGTGRGVPLVPAICWHDGGQTAQCLDAVLAKGQMMPEKGRFPAVLMTVNARQDPNVTIDGVGALDRFQNTHALLHEMRVRKLMPVECERLQGFDDGWTDVPGASKTARYKAIGNSMAVPCVQWILDGVRRFGRAA